MSHVGAFLLCFRCPSSSGLQRAPACFRARMEKLGLLDPSLLDTIASLPADEVIAIFRDVSSSLTMDGYSMRDFYELLSTSHEPASRRRRVLAKLPMEEFSVLGASSTAITEQMEPPPAPAPEAIPPPRAGKHLGRWPARMAKVLAEAQGPQAQQEIERKERERWLDVAVELAKQYDLQSGDSLLDRWTRQVWCGARLVGGAPRRYARGSAIFSVFATGWWLQASSLSLTVTLASKRFFLTWWRALPSLLLGRFLGIF